MVNLMTEFAGGAPRSDPSETWPESFIPIFLRNSLTPEGTVNSPAYLHPEKTAGYTTELSSILLNITKGFITKFLS